MTARVSARNDAAPVPLVTLDDHMPQTRLANAVAAAGNAGYLVTPPLLAAAMARLAAVTDEHAKAAAELRAAGGVPATAADVADVAGLEAEVLERLERVPRLELRVELLRQARSSAWGSFGETVAANFGPIFDALDAALAETLAAAAPDAPIVLAGVRSWERPEGLLDAPEDVAEAFGRLRPLAPRHDAIRAAVVLAYRLTGARSWEWPPRDTRIRSYEGGGVVFTRSGGWLEDGSPATDELQSVDYRPVGHPVQRLAIAASTR